jgi:[phosphatase 2A protein]-leucine-carboxy methyltransferase
MARGIAHFHSVYGPKSQAVAIGCGYDTMFWLNRQAGLLFHKWFDIDKSEVVNRKRSIISENSLFEPLTNYFLHSTDFDSIQDLPGFLSDIGFEPLPTLFIDEFSLIYVSENSFDSILTSIAKRPRSEFMSYGMTMNADDFGKRVQEGFAELGIPLRSYGRTGTPPEAIAAMAGYGFAAVSVVPSDAAVRAVLPPEDKARIARLDIFDRPGEMQHILAHYITIYAGSPEFTNIPLETRDKQMVVDS